MAPQFTHLSTLVISFFFGLHSSLLAISDTHSQYFTLMKNSLLGNALCHWSTKGENYCNYTGITCNIEGQVTTINIFRLATRRGTATRCVYLPELLALDISSNKIKGSFPESIVNCSHLEVLNMGFLFLARSLPHGKPSCAILTVHLFTGNFPIWIINLTNLKALNLNENENFNPWELPENINQLTRLETLVLSTTMLQGCIVPSMGNMTSVVDLELSGNYLKGRMPPERGRLKNLKSLMLYYSELSRTIPEALGNLTELTALDVSVNLLSGRTPDSICRLSKLQVLQLYNNSLTGEIPAILGNSKTLSILSVYQT